MSDELKPCPFCKEKASHGLTRGQRDMHGDLNQNYAVWCPSGHARITAADREKAAGIWNTRADLAPTDAQIMAHPKVVALVDAATALMLDPTWGLDHKQYQELRHALSALTQPQRCAECDCEHGGADCNWIVKGRRDE